MARQPALYMVTSNRKSNWHFPLDLLLCFLPGIIGLTVSVILSPIPLLCWTAAICGITGVVLLGRARFPLYRRRRLFNFGCAALDETHRKLYLRAWRWIGFCVGLLLLLNVLVRYRS